MINPIISHNSSNNETSCQLWKLTPRDLSFVRVFLDLDKPVTLDSLSSMLPLGAYSTFRTYYHNRIIHLEEHFDRLQTTASLASQPVSFDRKRVRRGLKAIIDHQHGVDLRVRLTVDLQISPGTFYISTDILCPLPVQYYLDGVAVISRRMHRENPKAKLTNFIATASQTREELPQGINEAVMISDDGEILEGLSSNFFGVKEGEIWTAGEGVLDGLTRKMVLEEAAKEKIKVNLNAIKLDAVSTLDEAWITSASRAVLPVVKVDNFLIGSGKPGPISKILGERFNNRIQAEAEPV